MSSSTTDLSKRYSQDWFEKLINGLSIKEGKETYLRHQVIYLQKQLKRVSKWPYNPPETSIQNISNNFNVIRFWYGGSFDRGIHINKEFDIDIYIIYDLIDKNAVNIDLLTGEYLFTILYEDLSAIHNEINDKLELMDDLPFSHAIPIELEYTERCLKLDCIPAIELPNQFLLVPDGWNDHKKVNLKLEENALSKVNKEHDGNATKLILLIKYWSWYWGNPVKSYVIQRFVEEVFAKRKIQGWKGALKIFFRESVDIIENYLDGKLVLKDRVYTNKSILDEYERDMSIGFYQALEEAQNLAESNQWEELYGK